MREDEEGVRAAYAVTLTQEAEVVYRGIPSKYDFAKVDKMLLILDTLPEIGRVYDPDYEAMRLPFEVRVAYAGRYGVYYTVDEEERQVIVFAIEDQRRNPLNRFYGVYPHEA